MEHLGNIVAMWKLYYIGHFSQYNNMQKTQSFGKKYFF